MLKMALFYEWMFKPMLSEAQRALAEQLAVAFITTVGSKPVGRAPQISPYKPEIAGITHGTRQSCWVCHPAPIKSVTDERLLRLKNRTYTCNLSFLMKKYYNLFFFFFFCPLCHRTQFTEHNTRAWPTSRWLCRGTALYSFLYPDFLRPTKL